MKSKRLDHRQPEQTYALIFDQGDEVMASLRRFVDEQHLDAAHFTAIGAFSDATIAWFDWESKQYKKIPVLEQVEVLMLAGDVSLKADGSRQVHAHVVLGTSEGNARGGHLMEAHVRPTLEVILNESPAHLRRRHDPASGLELISV
jgi:uncharacterized protein